MASVAIMVLFGLSKVIFFEEKKATLGDFSILTYNVGADRKLSGTYVIVNSDKKTWLRGSYLANERVGNWYCFNSDGKVFLRYNFDQKKLLQLDTTAMKNVEINILSEDAETIKNSTIPVPMCSPDQYISLFSSQIASVVNKEIHLPAEVPITVIAKLDKRNKVDYMLTYTIGKTTYTSPLKMQETKFDIVWLPATFDGKPVASEFIIKSTYKKDQSGRLRFKWNY